MSITDVGSQVLAVAYNAAVNTTIVNKAMMNIIPTGIYSGGICSRLSDTQVRITPLVCEITDGTYQIRVATTINVDLTMAEATPYVVLRWASASVKDTDFMEILAVGKTGIEENDLVVCYAVYSGSGVIEAVTYADETDYVYRSIPAAQSSWLKVSIYPSSTTKLFVQGGWALTGSAPVFISPTEITLSSSNTYFIYADPTTKQSIASTDTDHKGKLALAVVRYDGSLVFGDITDIRSFLTPVIKPDGTTIQFDSNGELGTVDTPVKYNSGSFAGSSDEPIQKDVGFVPTYVVVFNDSGNSGYFWREGLEKSSGVPGLKRFGSGDIYEQSGRVVISGQFLTFAANDEYLSKSGYTVFWVAFG